MKKTIVMIMMIMLIPFIGCKKSNVQMDVLSVSINPEQVQSGGQAWVSGNILNPSQNIYNLFITPSVGWMSMGAATFASEFVRVYNAIKNTSDLPILITIIVNVRANTPKPSSSVNQTKTLQVYILPEPKEGEKEKALDFSQPFKYIDSRTGKFMRYIPNGEPEEVE